MKDNKQQVDLIDLLMNDRPKDVIDKWNNSDLQDAILSIWKKTLNFTFALLVSGWTFCNQTHSLTLENINSNTTNKN